MEPIKTDERLAQKAKRTLDMDDHMLLGCSGFVVASFASYLLAVWPFFVWLDIHLFDQLLKTCLAGIPLAYLVGGIITWKFGLPGAAGHIGGMLAASIFLYLRLEQVFLEAMAQRTTPPEFPQWLQWGLPVMNISITIVLVSTILSLTNDHKKSKNRQ